MLVNLLSKVVPSSVITSWGFQTDFSKLNTTPDFFKVSSNANYELIWRTILLHSGHCLENTLFLLDVCGSTLLKDGQSLKIEMGMN